MLRSLSMLSLQLSLASLCCSGGAAAAPGVPGSGRELHPNTSPITPCFLFMGRWAALFMRQPPSSVCVVGGMSDVHLYMEVGVCWESHLVVQQ